LIILIPFFFHQKLEACAGARTTFDGLPDAKELLDLHFPGAFA